MKNPGESVRSNEAVVRLAPTDKYKFVGWVPLETAVRLKGNEAVVAQADHRRARTSRSREKSASRGG